MDRKKTSDRYVHGPMGRRVFLDGAARFAVGGMTAAMVPPALTPTHAEAQQVPEHDGRLVAEYVQFSSPEGHGTMRGYLARPWRTIGRAFRAPAGLTGRRRPGVLVVHENRGLTPHIEDVARRLTLENVIAFAPDALAPLGGYRGNEDNAGELFGKLDPARTRDDFVAAANYLKTLRECTGLIAVVGFGYGGGLALMLAARLPDLAAAVAFYGSPPAAEDVARMKAPLLLHYAENDEPINAGWPAFEAALKARGVPYVMHRYPATRHGFHNDTTAQYDETAATLAWSRTTAFLRRALRA